MAPMCAQLSEGEIEGRRQAMAFFEFLRREAPGFDNAYVVDIAPQLGMRETRRVHRPYLLTADDVLSCASFDDTVGSTAGRSKTMSPATWCCAGPTSQRPRLQPPAISHAGAARPRQSLGRRPMRFDDPRGPICGTRQWALFRHGPGRRNGGASFACRKCCK